MADDCTPILASQLLSSNAPLVGSSVIFAKGDTLYTTNLDSFLALVNQGAINTIYLNTPSNEIIDARYMVIEHGTFTNVTPNITVTEADLRDNWVYIDIVDGEATKQLISKPANKQEIERWQSNEGLTYPEVRTHNDAIWRVIDGVTTASSDEPSDNSLAWQKIANISDEADLSDILDDIEQLQLSKQNNLLAGLNITIVGSTISAKDTTYTGRTNEIEIINNEIRLAQEVKDALVYTSFSRFDYTTGDSQVFPIVNNKIEEVTVNGIGLDISQYNVEEFTGPNTLEILDELSNNDYIYIYYEK